MIVRYSTLLELFNHWTQYTLLLRSIFSRKKSIIQRNCPRYSLWSRNSGITNVVRHSQQRIHQTQHFQPYVEKIQMEMSRVSVARSTDMNTVNISLQRLGQKDGKGNLRYLIILTN